ncbi:MAG: TIR domain-containing protein [Caulobacterales bacterium]
MAQIFLSYASQDRLRIKPLAEALEARGFSVWWDRALGAGEDYAAVITRELSAAKVVIVVWTDASAASTFVRDEAGRARDQGRLIPVMLDRVQIPLGFGAFQAEDFSAWNGRAEAAQMQLLEEAIHAKLEGRAIDGGAVAAKRRRLMSRIRIVSVLTVVAAIAVIAFVGNQFINPPEIVQPQDPRNQLLDLVNQGKLTPEQAIELARLLESGALGETEVAANEAPSAGAPAPDAASRTMTAESEQQVATVTSAEFDAASRDTYRESITQLLTSSDVRVRTAALQLSNDATRDEAMRTLWSIAEQGGPNAAAIYKVCGAVGEANNHPLGVRALERARNANPQDAQVWRMLSYGLRRSNQTAEAEGAALVGAGLEAQAEGQTEVAEQRLEQALPNLQAVEGRAFVEGQLGDVAARRNDWAAATSRYRSAFELRERAAPNTSAAQGLQVDAQKLVRALDRDGRTEEACRQAQDVQQDHEVAPADQELAQRCQRYRITVRPQVLQPQQQQRLQTAPAQRITPAQ